MKYFKSYLLYYVHIARFINIIWFFEHFYMCILYDTHHTPKHTHTHTHTKKTFVNPINRTVTPQTPCVSSSGSTIFNEFTSLCLCLHRQTSAQWQNTAGVWVRRLRQALSVKRSLEYILVKSLVSCCAISPATASNACLLSATLLAMLHLLSCAVCFLAAELFVVRSRLGMFKYGERKRKLA